MARDIQRHDAVGNFCRQIHSFLSALGFDAELVAENCHSEDRASIATLPVFFSQIAADDIVIFHFSTEDPSLPAIAALPNPKVLYFHNITPERFFAGVDERTAGLVRLGLQQRPLAGSFDILMANSRISAGDLHDGLAPDDRDRISLQDIVTCPPVVGIDRWDAISEEPAPIAINDRSILYVGRLVPHKGVTELVAGFAQLAEKSLDTRLVCVGGPPEPAYATSLKKQLSDLAPAISDRITFLHSVSDGTLKTLYHRAGLCTSMSSHEGFGIPLVDALVADKPLVIHAEPGMVETVGDAGLWVDTLAPGAIARVLGEALENQAVRDKLAVARRTRLAQLRHMADGHLILDAIDKARTLYHARIV